jgi:gluconokinase
MFKGAAVVMGVSSCGKTSVGLALADKLATAFIEGDKLHP